MFLKNWSWKGTLRKALPNIIAVFVFLLVAFVYFKPVFENKVLFQEDVLQWQGMARSSFQYKDTHGHFPLWTTSMFSGMPAYQIAMDNPQSLNVVGIIYNLMTLYLKKPVSFFFLACICFYFLTRVLRINPYIGIIGGLAYAYATYNPVIIVVGHDTKMQSIALLPAFIGSLILIYERKYWQGAATVALFTALLFSTGHMQIVYYGLIMAIGLSLSYVIQWIHARDWKRLRTAGVVALGSGVIGLLCNAIVLFTTYDSSKETIRGGSELAGSKTNYTESGLNNSLAFDYSMYKIEPFVMLVPKMFGGSTGPELNKENSKAMEALQQMPPGLASHVQEGLRYYWGGIGDFVAGPPYAGAIICFLALIGFLIVDNKHKWWIGSVFLITILMSWGGYFEVFNSVLLKFLPMYNKFRAPSMIIVIPTFLLCLMAMLSLQKIFEAGDPSMLWRKYKWGLLLTAGIFGVLLFLYHHFDYTTTTDMALLKEAGSGDLNAVRQIGAFINGLKEDRQSLFLGSLLRSFGFIVAAALVIGLQVKYRIRPGLVLGLVGVLCFVDVMGMDMEYLNHDNYQKPVEYQQNFVPSAADGQIMRDKENFRVFDLRDSASNALSYGAMTAWFHHSIGGYHAAKLKIYEDLINNQLMNFPYCQPVINMLNTRYIIYPTTNGNDSVYRNPDALGTAWFVSAVRFEPTPLAVMNALTRFHPKDTAILFESDRKLAMAGVVTDSIRARRLAERNAWLAEKSARNGARTDKVSIRKLKSGKNVNVSNIHVNYADSAHWGAADSMAAIHLVKNDNDEILYRSDAPTRKFAVFSEIYYQRGWRAWIDGKETPIYRTNYVLRGLSVPAGHHSIRFAFHPPSYYLGRQVQWMACIILTLLIAAGIIVNIQDSKHGNSGSELLSS